MPKYVLEPEDHTDALGSFLDVEDPGFHKTGLLTRAKDLVLGATKSLPPKFVSRSAWGARPPESRSDNIRPADGGVAWHYEGPKVGKTDHDDCAKRVRQIQAFHMGAQRGWVDIAYSALVCRHGYVYEGRGIKTRTAANGTNTGNLTHYAVCGLMGEGDDLTAEMLQGFKDATIWLRTSGGAGMSIKPHRYFKSTGCPGSLLTDQANKYDGKGLTQVVAPKPAPASHTGHPHALPLLRKGSTGSLVKDAQGHLNFAFRNYADIAPLVCDGVWGERMEIRFREWQRRTGLQVDGDLGPESWKRLHHVTEQRRHDENRKVF